MQTRTSRQSANVMQRSVAAFVHLPAWLVVCILLCATALPATAQPLVPAPVQISPAEPAAAPAPSGQDAAAQAPADQIPAEPTPPELTPSDQPQAGQAFAPPPAPLPDDAEQKKTASDSPWNLTADRVSTNHAAGISQAWGNAVLRSGNSYLKADFLEYHRDSGWIYLKGNVHTYFGDIDVYAEEAEFDLATKTGKIRNGTIFIEENAVVVKGKELHKTGPETYAFGEAELTGCAGPTPLWSIKATGGEMAHGAYADIDNPTFQIAGVPVAWIPMARLPMRAKRQTGLMPPTWGSSSRLGGYYSQPFYWAIDEESDATFYADYFGKRGVMGGIEYRNTPDSHSQGLWRFDYVNDRVVADTAAEQESQFISSGLARTNHNRYWLRSKYDGWVFDPKYEVKLDLDYASDYSYLRTFDLNHTNFGRSNSDFVGNFGRSLDTVDSYTRTSTGLVSRSWDAQYAMNLKAEYTEDLRYRSGNLSGSKNPTVQRLPELSAYVYKQSLPGTPLEIQADSSLTYFARNYGTQGGRLDMTPQVSLPLSSAYGTIIPTVGWRETLYNVTDFENNPAGRSNDDQQERHLANMRTTAFSEIFGVYSLDIDPMFQNPEAIFTGNSTLVGLKHSIQPRLDYARQQYRDQAKLPDFDSFDRLGPVNELRYSLTNLLNTKRGTITQAPDKDGDSAPYLTYSYRDLLRNRLEQAYDYNEADRTNDTSRYPTRPFSDILSQTELSPLDWLSLINKVYVSPYGEGVTQIENSVGFSDVDYGFVSVGYAQYSQIDEYKRRNRQSINMVNLNAKLHLPYEFTLEALHQRDIKENISINSAIRLTRHAQCYDISLHAAETRYDRSLSLWVSILGFDTPQVETSQSRDD